MRDIVQPMHCQGTPARSAVADKACDAAALREQISAMPAKALRFLEQAEARVAAAEICRKGGYWDANAHMRRVKDGPTRKTSGLGQLISEHQMSGRRAFRLVGITLAKRRRTAGSSFPAAG